MEFIPPDFRHRWMRVLEACLRSFARAPSLPSLSLLFLASKALLAEPRRGGKARAEAVSRTFRARFALWDIGDYTGLWELVRRKKPTKAKQGDKTPDFKQIAHLVDCGLLSKAAARLASKGVAPVCPEVFGQVKKLSPSSPPHKNANYPESAALEVTTAELHEKGCFAKRSMRPEQVLRSLRHKKDVDVELNQKNYLNY